MQRTETVEDWLYNFEAGKPSPNASKRDLSMRDLIFYYQVKPNIERHIETLKTSLNGPKNILWEVSRNRWAKLLKRREKSLIWIRNEIKRLAYCIATTS